MTANRNKFQILRWFELSACRTVRRTQTGGEVEQANLIEGYENGGGRLSQNATECGDQRKAHAESLEIVSRELGLRFWFGYAAFARGYTVFRNGDLNLGPAEMRRGLEMLREQGIAWCVPLLQAIYAEAECATGQIGSAVATIEGATAFGKQTGQRWIEAELYRLRGEISLRAAPSNAARAEAALTSAVEIARNQQTRTFELRAAVSLARLWRDRGKRDDAQDLLVPVYNSFAECFDLDDLKEAKLLLDELVS